MIVRGQPKNAEVHAMFSRYTKKEGQQRDSDAEENVGLDATNPAPEIQEAAPAQHTVSTAHLLSEEDLDAMRRQGM